MTSLVTENSQEETTDLDDVAELIAYIYSNAVKDVRVLLDTIVQLISIMYSATIFIYKDFIVKNDRHIEGYIIQIESNDVVRFFVGKKGEKYDTFVSMESPHSGKLN